jgi:hypothetical protein
MNQQSPMNLKSRYAKVATIVTDYDIFPYGLPLPRSVEFLIDPSVKPERALSDNTAQFQIFVSFVKRV